MKNDRSGCLFEGRMDKQMPIRVGQESDVEKHEGGASHDGCIEIIHVENLWHC